MVTETEQGEPSIPQAAFDSLDTDRSAVAEFDKDHSSCGLERASKSKSKSGFQPPSLDPEDLKTLRDRRVNSRTNAGKQQSWIDQRNSAFEMNCIPLL
jgi:hypothetical protein